MWHPPIQLTADQVKQFLVQPFQGINVRGHAPSPPNLEAAAPVDPAAGHDASVAAAVAATAAPNANLMGRVTRKFIRTLGMHQESFDEVTRCVECCRVCGRCVELSC